MDHPAHTTHPHQLPSLLHAVASQLDKRSDQSLMEQLGLGLSQFNIMQVMKGTQGVTQRYIAQQLGQTEASVSRQVKLLRQRGFAEVVVRPDNKREHRVWLTPRGMRLYHEATRVVTRAYRPVLGRMSDKSRIQLHEALAALHRCL